MPGFPEKPAGAATPSHDMRHDDKQTGYLYGCEVEYFPDGEVNDVALDSLEEFEAWHPERMAEWRSLGYHGAVLIERIEQFVRERALTGDMDLPSVPLWQHNGCSQPWLPAEPI